jgi:hypothetical protein
MSNKLSDQSIESLRRMLRATELSVGQGSTSAKIIRRELERKQRQLAIDNGKRPSAKGGAK